MSRQIEPSATWPYALALVGLFTLCLNSPPSWESVARDHAITTTVAATTVLSGTLTKTVHAASQHETPRQVVSDDIATGAAKSHAVKSHAAEPRVARRTPPITRKPAVRKSAAPKSVTTRSQLSAAPDSDAATSAPGDESRVAAIETSSVDLPLWTVSSSPAPADATSAADGLSPSVALGPSLLGPTLLGPTPLTSVPSESVAAAPLVPPAGSHEPLVDTSVDITVAAPADAAEAPEAGTTAAVVSDVGVSDAELNSVAGATAGARLVLDLPSPPGVVAATVTPLPPNDQALNDQAPTVYTRFDRLAWECHTSQWAGRALELLRQFDAGFAARDVDAVVATMRRLSLEADRLAKTAASEQLSADIRRARHALIRSTDAWRLAVAMQRGTTHELALAQRRDGGRLAERLRVLSSATHDDEVTEAWREYLMLDVIANLSAPQSLPPLDNYRDLVEQTVRRLDGGGLTAQQRAYVAQQRFAALSTELKTWVSEPVDPREFLTRLATYERTRLPSDARLVARDLRNLNVAPSSEVRQLGKRMEAHYRNANLRIAISAELVSRLLPTLPETDSPVRKRIMDADVRGWQHTETTLSVRLVPDASRLHMVLQAQGSVTANTHAHSGPATLRNSSVAHFQLEKQLLHSAETISTAPATVTVDATVCLRGVATDLDVVPLVGGFTRHIVEQQALSRQDMARHIMERQVASEVLRRVDELADEKLVAMNEAIQQRFFQPMRNLGLAPQMVETRTDQRRMTVRMRLASERQLGAHTPRPRAPSDSLLSMQFHDSAINNLIEQFNLEGGTFTPDELTALVAEKLNRTPKTDDESTVNSNNVRITFANEDPVRIRCEDGLVHVRLAFQRFQRGKKIWKDVVAEADYRPRIEGFTMSLDREGALQLSGPMSRRQRVGLRTIFAKILPRQRELANLIPQSVDATQISDLEITQLVLADGWIAVAVGPRRDDLASRGMPAPR